MHDELRRLNRICDRWEFYAETPTLEDLKELLSDMEDAESCAHDDCYSADSISEMVDDETREKISELESEVLSLKAELESRPKRTRKKKPVVNFESLEETRSRLNSEYRKCKCDESECTHWKRLKTVENWIGRGKELAS